MNLLEESLEHPKEPKDAAVIRQPPSMLGQEFLYLETIEVR